MARRLTVIIEKEGSGYVAICPEFDVASQGDSVEEARKNIKEALELFFEVAPREEVKRRLRGEVYVTQVEVTAACVAKAPWQADLSPSHRAWIRKDPAARRIPSLARLYNH